MPYQLKDKYFFIKAINKYSKSIRFKYNRIEYY